MQKRALWVGAMGAVSVLSFVPGLAYAASCGGLAGKTYGPASIVAATEVSPPSAVVGKDPPTPVALDQPFCRIEGAIKPTADSDIRFELWLPPEAKWNGKYEGVGNGGFAGSLIYPSMKWALDGGYATSGTDTGHDGGSLESNWALGHPEKIVDFGCRANFNLKRYAVLADGWQIMAAVTDPLDTRHAQAKAYADFVAWCLNNIVSRAGMAQDFRGALFALLRAGWDGFQGLRDRVSVSGGRGRIKRTGRAMRAFTPSLPNRSTST